MPNEQDGQAQRDQLLHVVRGMEDMHNELTSIRTEMRNELKDIRNEMHTHNLNVTRLETEFKLRTCPSPGKCEALAPAVESLNKRLRVFEDGALQVKGAKKATIVIIMLCSAFGGAVGAKTMKVVDSFANAVTSK